MRFLSVLLVIVIFAFVIFQFVGLIGDLKKKKSSQKVNKDKEVEKE